MGKTLLILFCLLFIFSCKTQTINDNNDCIIPVDGIYGGNPVTGEKWSSTVALTTINNPQQFCSGVLISKNIVLTAAHCLDYPALQPIPEKVKIYLGNGEENKFFRGTYEIKEALIHPDWNQDQQYDRFDMGYIVLKTDVPKELVNFVAPLQSQDEIDEVLFRGNNVTIVGFGATEKGIRGKKHEVETTIKSFSKVEVFIGGDGKDSCNGDSGGPVYVKLKNGEMRLLGITSRGGACGTGGLYTLAHAAITWAEDSLNFNRGSLSNNPYCEF